MAKAKYLIRLRTKTVSCSMVFKTNSIAVPMAENSFEIPFPMALKRTPKSISSLSFVFLGLDVLMLFLFNSVLR